MDGDTDDDDLDDDDNEWTRRKCEDANERTLRKCSAASLDTLVGAGGAPAVLPPLLPALQEGIGHPDKWVRKAGIHGVSDRRGSAARDCLSSSAAICGLNYKPWALESSALATSTIEAPPGRRQRPPSEDGASRDGGI